MSATWNAVDLPPSVSMALSPRSCARLDDTVSMAVASYTLYMKPKRACMIIAVVNEIVGVEDRHHDCLA